MPRIYSLESTIGGGKTTLISMLKKRYGDRIIIVYEPIDEWQDVGGINLLDLFYQDQIRYGYMFQTYGFVTRVNKLEEFIENLNDDVIVIIERSWHSDNNTFAQVLYEEGKISDLQWNLYQKWFKWECKHAPKIDGYIYLRTNVDVAVDRIHKRNRSEEGGIPREYLQKLHDKHDEWLNNRDDVLVVDGDLEFETNGDRFDHIFESIDEFIQG
jgi:deoxyguanosine kinase